MSRSQVVLWSLRSRWSAFPFIFSFPRSIGIACRCRSARISEQDKDPIIFKILNLGLDLRGGTHLVLEIDRSKLDPKPMSTTRSTAPLKSSATGWINSASRNRSSRVRANAGSWFSCPGLRIRNAPKN